MMGLRSRQGNLRLVSVYLSLMLGKPHIRLNNLKTSLRFSCLIIDSISLLSIPCHMYVMTVKYKYILGQKSNQRMSTFLRHPVHNGVNGGFI